MKVVYKIYKEDYCEFEYFDGYELSKTKSDDIVLTLVCIDDKYEYETEEEAMLALEEIMNSYDYTFNTFTILKCYKK